jgi:hypothetical protein
MTWLILTIALIFQEVATAGAALLSAHENGLNPWLIHAIWFAATIGDIAIGYYLGKWIQLRFKNSKIDIWAKKWAVKIDRSIGKTGMKISLILLGIVMYPYLLAFVASWLPNLSLEDIFLYTTAGNLIWYIFEWATILGITAAGHNYQLIFAIIAAVGIVAILVVNFIRRKIEV